MPRFLIVDDDPAHVSGIERLLRYDGHEVVPHLSGADAVDALARESFDAVVTDLEMPHTDGHAVVSAARRHQPAACVVVATASPHENWQRLADAGACIIADKPFDYDSVASAVTECRARGGPGAHGGCHLRGEPPLVRPRVR